MRKSLFIEPDSGLVITVVMIWLSARGAYLLLEPQGRAPVRNRALISFLRNSRMWNKALMVSWLRITRQKNRLVVPRSFLAIAIGTSYRRKILRRDLSLEWTVDSWETETKTTFCREALSKQWKEDGTQLISLYMYCKSAITETE